MPFEKLQQDTARDRQLPATPGQIATTLVAPGAVGAEAQWLSATVARGNAPCLLPNARSMSGTMTAMNSASETCGWRHAGHFTRVCVPSRLSHSCLRYECQQL